MPRFASFSGTDVPLSAQKYRSETESVRRPGNVHGVAFGSGRSTQARKTPQKSACVHKSARKASVKKTPARKSQVQRCLSEEKWAFGRSPKVSRTPPNIQQQPGPSHTETVAEADAFKPRTKLVRTPVGIEKENTLAGVSIARADTTVSACETTVPHVLPHDSQSATTVSAASVVADTISIKKSSISSVSTALIPYVPSTAFAPSQAGVTICSSSTVSSALEEKPRMKLLEPSVKRKSLVASVVPKVALTLAIPALERRVPSPTLAQPLPLPQCSTESTHIGSKSSTGLLSMPPPLPPSQLSAFACSTKIRRTPPKALVAEQPQISSGKIKEVEQVASFPVCPPSVTKILQLQLQEARSRESLLEGRGAQLENAKVAAESRAAALAEELLQAKNASTALQKKLENLEKKSKILESRSQERDVKIECIDTGIEKEQLALDLATARCAADEAAMEERKIRRSVLECSVDLHRLARASGVIRDATVEAGKQLSIIMEGVVQREVELRTDLESANQRAQKELFVNKELQARLESAKKEALAAREEGREVASAALQDARVSKAEADLALKAEQEKTLEMERELCELRTALVAREKETEIRERETRECMQEQLKRGVRLELDLLAAGKKAAQDAAGGLMEVARTCMITVMQEEREKHAHAPRTVINSSVERDEPRTVFDNTVEGCTASGGESSEFYDSGEIHEDVSMDVHVDVGNSCRTGDSAREPESVVDAPSTSMHDFINRTRTGVHVGHSCRAGGGSASVQERCITSVGDIPRASNATLSPVANMNIDENIQGPGTDIDESIVCDNTSTSAPPSPITHMNTSAIEPSSVEKSPFPGKNIPRSAKKVLSAGSSTSSSSDDSMCDSSFINDTCTSSIISSPEEVCTKANTKRKVENAKGVQKKKDTAPAKAVNKLTKVTKVGNKKKHTPVGIDTSKCSISAEVQPLIVLKETNTVPSEWMRGQKIMVLRTFWENSEELDTVESSAGEECVIIYVCPTRVEFLKLSDFASKAAFETDLTEYIKVYKGRALRKYADFAASTYIHRLKGGGKKCKKVTAANSTADDDGDQHAHEHASSVKSDSAARVLEVCSSQESSSQAVIGAPETDYSPPKASATVALLQHEELEEPETLVEENSGECSEERSEDMMTSSSPGEAVVAEADDEDTQVVHASSANPEPRRPQRGAAKDARAKIGANIRDEEGGEVSRKESSKNKERSENGVPPSTSTIGNTSAASADKAVVRAKVNRAQKKSVTKAPSSDVSDAESSIPDEERNSKKVIRKNSKGKEPLHSTRPAKNVVEKYSVASEDIQVEMSTGVHASRPQRKAAVLAQSKIDDIRDGDSASKPRQQLTHSDIVEPSVDSDKCISKGRGRGGENGAADGAKKIRKVALEKVKEAVKKQVDVSSFSSEESDADVDVGKGSKSKVQKPAAKVKKATKRQLDVSSSDSSDSEDALVDIDKAQKSKVQKPTEKVKKAARRQLDVSSSSSQDSDKNIDVDKTKKSRVQHRNSSVFAGKRSRSVSSEDGESPLAQRPKVQHVNRSDAANSPADTYADTYVEPYAHTQSSTQSTQQPAHAKASSTIHTNTQAKNKRSLALPNKLHQPIAASGETLGVNLQAVPGGVGGAPLQMNRKRAGTSILGSFLNGKNFKVPKLKARTGP